MLQLQRLKDLRSNDMRTMLLLEWRSNASRYIFLTILLVVLYFFGDVFLQPHILSGQNCSLWYWLASIYPLSMALIPLYLMFTEGMYWYYCTRLFCCACVERTETINEKE